MPISNNGLLSIVCAKDYIFVGSGDGKVKKICVSEGKWNLTHEAVLDSKIMSLCISADQKEIIAGSVGGKIYRILEHDLSHLLHTDSHTGAIMALSFSPRRSDQFLSLDKNGCIKMWDLSEYKSVFSVVPQRQASGSSCCVALDDESLVSGWSDGFIRCYSKGNSSPVWEVANAHRGAVTSLYADGNYILSGGEDGAVRVWGRANRKLLIQFNDQKKDVVSVFPDLNKPHIIHSCSADRTISTYDLKIEKRIGGHQTFNGSLLAMSQRRDNEFELVTCGQGCPLYFWDQEEINPVAQIDYPYKVLSVQVSPSGRMIAFGTETNEVFVYSLHLDGPA
jgi:WD40 repeat protein